jgi:hypothetical protein
MEPHQLYNCTIPEPTYGLFGPTGVNPRARLGERGRFLSRISVATAETVVRAGRSAPVAWTSAPIDRTWSLSCQRGRRPASASATASRIVSRVVSSTAPRRRTISDSSSAAGVPTGRRRGPIRGRTAAPRPMWRLARRQCGTESRRSTPGRPSLLLFAFGPQPLTPWHLTRQRISNPTNRTFAHTGCRTEGPLL